VRRNLAGVNGGAVKGLSVHSMRVGAAQEMLVAGFDALAIMQAGGRKTTAVLLRYVENASTRALHERRWQSVRALSAGSF
jgi:integrase/recombinase XerD